MEVVFWPDCFPAPPLAPMAAPPMARAAGIAAAGIGVEDAKEEFVRSLLL